MLALDFERGGRRQGVGAGLLDGNAVSEECERVAAMIEPAFSINAIVNEHGHAEKVFVGGWRAAHRRACAEYTSGHSAKIKEKRDVVIVSCGGAPYDINMIQAHKALDMAAHACVDGGTIVFLAECGDGLGRADFMKWFESKDSRALENRLREAYEVNGQTAWALLTKTERFHVHIVTELNDEQTRGMRMTKSAGHQRGFGEYFGECERLYYAAGRGVVAGVSEPGAVATGSKTQVELRIRSLPLPVLTRRPPEGGTPNSNSVSCLTHKYVLIDLLSDCRARRSECCACISARRAARPTGVTARSFSRNCSELRQPPPINSYCGQLAACAALVS